MNASLLALLVVLAQEEAAPVAEHAVKDAAMEEQHAAAEHQPMDAPTFILHHVSDSDEYEFELPIPGVAHHPTLHLGEIFASLKTERVPGSCHATVTGPLSAVPTLGRFIEGCWDFRPTKATLMMWLAAVLLILFCLAGVRSGKGKLVPHGVVPNVLEVLVLFVRDEIVYKKTVVRCGTYRSPSFLPMFL